MRDDLTIDDLTVVGIDGIRRTFDEHYDTMMCVEQDPTGAHHAIHNQHARIDELDAKLAKAVKALEGVRAFVRDLAPYADQGHALVPALEKACTTLAELKGGEER